MALCEKMSPKGPFGDSSDNRLEAESHRSETTFKDGNNYDNIQDTSTTATTASETTKDILSVKNCFTKEILPPLAKKLAKAATLSAVLLGPVTDVFKATESQLDLMEVACSPTSTLTATFEKNGLSCERINHLSGYDLDTHRGTKLLAENIMAKKPRFTWV